MKRIALIAAAIVLSACGGAKDEAAAPTDEPAAMVETAPVAPAPDSTAVAPPADSGTAKPDSASM